MEDYILFMVVHGRSRVFTYAMDREHAKNNARSWLGHDPDQYIVEPLTNKGDAIKIDLTLYV